MAESVRKALTSVFGEDADDSTIGYFESMVEEIGIGNPDELKENLAPFIESYGLADDIEAAEKVCDKLCSLLNGLGLEQVSKDDAPQLLDKSVKLSSVADSTLSEAERAQVETLWGFESIRKKRNDVMEASEAGSQKYERKAIKEQKKWLQELDSKVDGGCSEDESNQYDENGEDGNQISAMTLPDLDSKCRERDIHVNNFNITYGGQLLLDSADLRLVYGRRYGLIGKNGVGKTTLLKHMASFDIEGFPRHHRVLHVKQEVRSSKDSVLQVVLAADVERASLLRREKELQERQRRMEGDEEAGGESCSTAQLQQLMDEMREVHERMTLIGAESTESRAASILAGLQFSEEMQAASTESLSGGWRMRVALAGALLVEPDLLMLDEPTNHLDLEAVLWLEEYLKDYPHTVLLVSHDRAFLNEVCTDIVLFNKQKLSYFRGDYDNFEATYREMRIVQQKQHEAQMVKVQHMQEFVDKFRFNAKRAALVQSRIKAIEKEAIVEAVEEEVPFQFSFYDAGQLGRPIIQIEGVTFGFPNAASAAGKAEAKLPLFENVHLDIDQSSRVALVGPNGAGKSTLINLLMGNLAPLDGIIRVNPQLRIGLFTQHHMDSFDLRLSPLQNMAQRWPLATEPDMRAHLGKFEITGTDSLKPMKFSSGGQKSRVAFAVLTFAKPHVVIMDEPTNHLDMGAIEALCGALKAFKGGVLVVSHDQHFITSVCNETWVIDKRRVTRFEGGFKEYKKVVVQKIRRRVELNAKARHQQRR